MVAKVKPTARRGRTSHERLFTVEDYHRMADAGVFRSDERVELLEGRVIVMAAKNTTHPRRCSSSRSRTRPSPRTEAARRNSAPRRAKLLSTRRLAGNLLAPREDP